jgi:hypothetical protein
LIREKKAAAHQGQRKKGQADETTWPFMVKAIRRRTSWTGYFE